MACAGSCNRASYPKATILVTSYSSFDDLFSTDGGYTDIHARHPHLVQGSWSTEFPADQSIPNVDKHSNLAIPGLQSDSFIPYSYPVASNVGHSTRFHGSSPPLLTGSFSPDGCHHTHWTDAIISICDGICEDSRKLAAQSLEITAKVRQKLSIPSHGITFAANQETQHDPLPLTSVEERQYHAHPPASFYSDFPFFVPPLPPHTFTSRIENSHAFPTWPSADDGFSTYSDELQYPEDFKVDSNSTALDPSSDDDLATFSDELQYPEDFEMDSNPTIIDLRDFSPEEIQQDRIARAAQSQDVLLQVEDEFSAYVLDEIEHTRPDYSPELTFHSYVSQPAQTLVDEIPALEFTLIRELPAGSGSSKVEVIRSDRPLDTHGYGLKPGSFWVLKSHKLVEHHRDLTEKEAIAIEEDRSQFLTEMQVFHRISDAPERETQIGFAFLLTAEATVICRGFHSIVMPLGIMDFRQLFEDKSLLPEEVPRLMAQMVLGVAALHNIGIIHNDIKPENILLDLRGNVKLADFGLSYIAEDVRPLEPERRYDNCLVGTKAYNAPEKEFCSSTTFYGIEVDYWALGCVFYEMVTAGEYFRTRKCNVLFDYRQKRMKWLELPDDSSRMQFLFPDYAPPSPVSNLVFGLLQKIAKFRYGIDQLRNHPYFRRADGTTEFDHLEGSLQRKEVAPHWKVSPESHESITATYSSVTWLNMRGAYFENTVW